MIRCRNYNQRFLKATHRLVEVDQWFVEPGIDVEVDYTVVGRYWGPEWCNAYGARRYFLNRISTIAGSNSIVITTVEWLPLPLVIRDGPLPCASEVGPQPGHHFRHFNVGG